MKKNGCNLQKGWTSIKETSAESILQIELLNPGERNRKDLSFMHTRRNQIDKSAFVTQKENMVGGGTNTVLNALAAYLRYLEGTAQDDWQEYVMTFLFCSRIITRVFEFEFLTRCVCEM